MVDSQRQRTRVLGEYDLYGGSFGESAGPRQSAVTRSMVTRSTKKRTTVPQTAARWRLAMRRIRRLVDG